MAAIPQKPDTTVTRIYANYEKRQAESKPRPHLGASLIGKSCSRAMWYDFRWATKAMFDGRMLRLFDTGNKEEFRLTVDLRNAGVTVLDKEPGTNKQYQFKDLGGHFSGSMDAAMQGLAEAPATWHVGEFKTHNLKSFVALKKEGVKLAKPEHWHQMNMYMGWSGMTRAAYFAVCKDNDEIYIERVEFDQATFDGDKAKARQIIESGSPLSRMSEDPTWFECTYCNHHAICHAQRSPEVNCRTCVHSTPVITGELDNSNLAPWHCAKHDRALSFDDQLAGCDSHLYIPDLVPIGVPEEAGDEFIVYTHKVNGKKFANATAIGMAPTNMELMKGQRTVGHYTSKELQVINPSMIGDERIDALKADFPEARCVA